MSNSATSKIETAIDALYEYKNLLIEHGGHRLTPGINGVASELIYSDDSPEDRLKAASRSYKRLFGTFGTLGDFIASNEDPLKAKAANIRLDEIQDKLWKIFNN